jgi:hypothetical protein
MGDLPINWQDDKKEQGFIKHAIWEAIPVGTHWHNIVIAVSDILKESVYESVKGKLKYYKKREYMHNEEET